jgi:hypothetical protein
LLNNSRLVVCGSLVRDFTKCTFRSIIFLIATEHVEILLQQGFSLGLARALAENTDSFDHRIWVVDNSGSMQIGDGHRVSETDGKITLQPVTRWEEIQDTVIYHSQMAAVLNSHTRFRLLNDPGPAVGRQEFSVAQQGRDVEHDIRQARLVMTRTKPDGVTPLTEHIWEMQAEVRQMLPELQRTGRRVSTVVFSWTLLVRECVVVCAIMVAVVAIFVPFSADIRCSLYKGGCSARHGWASNG